MTKNEYIEFGDESLKSFVLISNIKSVTFYDWDKIDPELGFPRYQLDVTYLDETTTTWKNADKEGLHSIYEKIRKALGVGITIYETGKSPYDISGLTDKEIYDLANKTLYNGTSTEL